MSERELVRLVTIDDVQNVPDSDNLDVVSVGGWNVVTQRGLYKPGDNAWYFEIDSLLPIDNPAFEFLGARGIKEVEGKKYHRLKTIKLRGQISQGLLVPYSEFSSLYYDTDPQPMTDVLGVLKYDDVVVTNAGNASTAGSFPSQFGQKTDAERVQNLKKYWPRISELAWVPTEKVDGCSLSVFRDETGELRVCSRNWEIKDADNIFWNTVRKYWSLFDDLEDRCGIQAEIIGPGIQNNRLGLADTRIVIFNVLKNGRALPYSDWADASSTADFFADLWDSYSAPVYEELPFPATVEEAIEQADGIKSLIAPDRLAEGIVWTNPDAVTPSFLGRHCWKVISNKYLLKEK